MLVNSLNLIKIFYCFKNIKNNFDKIKNLN